MKGLKTCRTRKQDIEQARDQSAIPPDPDKTISEARI